MTTPLPQLLERHDIAELCQATTAARLYNSRELVLDLCISAGQSLVSTLPTKETPIEQIVSDLNRLSQAPIRYQREHPLVRWLTNASALCRIRDQVEANTFDAKLQLVRRRLAAWARAQPDTGSFGIIDDEVGSPSVAPAPRASEPYDHEGGGPAARARIDRARGETAPQATVSVAGRPGSTPATPGAPERPEPTASTHLDPAGPDASASADRSSTPPDGTLPGASLRRARPTDVGYNRVNLRPTEPARPAEPVAPCLPPQWPLHAPPIRDDRVERQYSASTSHSWGLSWPLAVILGLCLASIVLYVMA